MHLDERLARLQTGLGYQTGQAVQENKWQNLTIIPNKRCKITEKKYLYVY